MSFCVSSLIVNWQVTGKVRPSRGQVFVNNEELSGLTKYQKLVG